MKLKTLEIDAFRGASKPLTIEFDADKRITMIFGENGNGKSTITDSLVCLCTDEHGSLDDKSSPDKKDFYASITRQPRDVKVVLTTDSGSFQTTLSSAAKFQKIPASGQPIVRHLRRSQITKFIEAPPSERYKELESFIDVSNVLKCEETLRSLQRDTEREQNLVINTLTEVSSTLEQTWTKEGKPLANWEVWAKQESGKDVAEEDKKYRILQGIVQKWSLIVETNNRWACDSMALQVAKAVKDEADRQMKEAQEGEDAEKSNLLSLLQSAKDFISAKDQIKSCPVCDNAIERDDIVASLASKIDSMKSFEALIKAINSAQKNVEQKQIVYDATVKSLVNKIEDIEKAVSQILEQPFSGLTVKLAFIKTSDEVEKKLEAFSAVFTELDKEFKQQSEQAQRIKTAIDQHNHIKGQYKSILDSRKKTKKTEKILDAAKRSLSVVETARKDFVQAELNSISSEVDTLYQKLHPKESLGGVSLTLKKGVKHSLELNADFHGKTGITPQSAYSESHLDTLGICVFLALAKKYSSTNSIVILDDVVMSVDEHHLDRFIDLLHDEADKFSHFIITTHYRPWKDRYRYNRAPIQKVHFVELRPWSLGNGIRVQNGKLAIDELRQALADPNYFDRQKITSISGVILENILDYLSVLFQCRVPRKPKNDYQLRELLDAISSKLMNLLKVEHLGKNPLGKYDGATISKTADLKTILNNIKQLAIVRNWVGAHFSYDGSTVSDADVEQFGKLTLELSELITCPDSGNFPDRNKSGSYWETKNGSIRLYPLQEP